MSNFLDKLAVRQMVKEDLDAIVEIDTKVLGESRKDYWVTKIIKQAENRPPDASLVAEIDEKVAGFILGEVSGWEFKVPNNIGWITPSAGPTTRTGHRQGPRRGPRRESRTGSTPYTPVNWNDGTSFSSSTGFSRGDMKTRYSRSEDRRRFRSHVSGFRQRLKHNYK